MTTVNSRSPEGVRYDIVLANGRVIDPETGTDQVANVGIVGHTIQAITSDRLDGADVIAADGLVVAPGFVDLHSHGQGLAEHRMRALDGVTTALELEAGVSPVRRAYANSAEDGRPINYGFAASWAGVRMHVVANAPFDASIGDMMDRLGSSTWRSTADARESDRIFELLEEELADGALGIGILVGYAPETDPSEYLRLAGLASDAGVPTYTHARPLVEQDAHTPVDGADEIARAAAESGAHMHFCHINSTSNQYLDRASTLIERAIREGASITVEGYPYGAGMTAIGADYFQPDRLHVLGVEPTDLVYARTGERVSGVDQLLDLRSSDPGGLAFVNYYDETSNPERLIQAISFPKGSIASDAMPFMSKESIFDPNQWPIPAFVRTHPRSCGTYGRRSPTTPPIPTQWRGPLGSSTSW